MWVGLGNSDRKFWTKGAIFARETVAPKVLDWDRTGRFPRTLWKTLSGKSLLGLGIPLTRGGAGGGLKRLALALDAFAYGSKDLGIVNSGGVHSAMVSSAISDAGSQLLKRRYLSKLFTGKVIGAFALTEPIAGSHAAGIQTTAKEEGNGYVLAGTKNFVTNGPDAGVFIIIARDVDRPEGSFSAFVVPRDTTGLVVGNAQEKSCIRTSQCCDITLNNCRIPADHLLGPRGGAMEKVVLPSLDRDRCIVWAGRLGRMRSILEDASTYALKRVQFGKPLARHQAILFKLAEIKIRLEASESLLSIAVERLASGQDVREIASIARFVLGEATKNSADAAMQIFGGYGFYPENHVERYHRDAQLDGIGGGSAEIQKLIIGRQVVTALNDPAWLSGAVQPSGFSVPTRALARDRAARAKQTKRGAAPAFTARRPKSAMERRLTG